MSQHPKLQQSKLHFEREAYCQGHTCVAGVDEAGRGPLAGPVVAAACILPRKTLYEGVDDSKKLTPSQREHLYQALTSDQRVHYGIGIVDHVRIDQINILQATIQAMIEAVNALACLPDLLLVDGMQLPHPSIFCQKIIKGDALSHSIAAASILAKVTRDRLMLEYHKQWPAYGFDRHKGYSTPYHRAALAEHGPSPIHRLTFSSSVLRS